MEHRPSTRSRARLSPAEKFELGDLARLLHDVWHETHARLCPPEVAHERSLAFFVKQLNTTRTRPIVARDIKGKLLGFVHWEKSFIQDLYLAPHARGLGVGSQLLQAAEAEMVRLGNTKCALMCVAGNDAARAFYEQSGFRVTLNQNVRTPVEGGEVIVKAWRMQKPLA